MAKNRVPVYGRALRVLVVDDEVPHLELARERLESEGHTVTAIGTAAGLEVIVAALAPDVVLLDALMPDLSGRELASLLARFPATRTPAVILHSSVPARGLYCAVDASRALGVIQKTSDDVQFFFAFNGLLDRLPETSALPDSSAARQPAASGTHRIDDDDATTDVDLISEHWFSRTRPGRG